MTPKIGTIDMTPTMLKSAEGRALVQDAERKLRNAIALVAHVLNENIDEMEHGTKAERADAFDVVRAALGAWHKIGSDFAFTLDGVNPETRERYSFPVEG